MIMKVLQSPGPITVAVVGCLHGNERIGQYVFNYYQTRISQFSGLCVVLANEEAIKQGIRGLEGDLNRSFPGSAQGNHEERLAREILAAVQPAAYVLDLHTTSAAVEMVPIVANLDAKVQRVINRTYRRELVLMPRDIAAPSLIGNVTAGVSLELNEEYAATPGALQEVISIVEGLLSGAAQSSRERRVFQVNGTIALDVSLGAEVADFTYHKGLNGYPFLLHEREYTTHQGFLARSFISQMM